VVAAGGLRTTQLLLALAQAWPRHFQSNTAPLGKYYMGHLTGEIAALVLDNPRDAAAYLYNRDPDGHWFQRRLKLPPSLQEMERVMNTAFTLRAPMLNDPRHRDGALSALALLAPALHKVSLAKSERLRAAAVGQRSSDRLLHLRNIIAQAFTTMRNLSAAAVRRRIGHLPFMTLNSAGRYALRYHAEQAPNQYSKVSLGSKNASRLTIDFQYTHVDVDSVVRSHESLDKSLRKLGIGRLEYIVPRDQCHDAVSNQARDGYHQIGTTRMSDNPLEGVVDRNCRVHGFANLYVASASALPTSGSANPTLPVVMMALRLADHLQNTIAR